MFQPILITCFIAFSTCYGEESKTTYKTETECLIAAEKTANKLMQVVKQKTKEAVTIHYGCKELELV